MSELEEISLISLIFSAITAVVMTILKVTIWSEYNTYSDWGFFVLIPAMAVMGITFFICVLLYMIFD